MEIQAGGATIVRMTRQVLPCPHSFGAAQKRAKLRNLIAFSVPKAPAADRNTLPQRQQPLPRRNTAFSLPKSLASVHFSISDGRLWRERKFRPADTQTNYGRPDW